MEKQKKQIEKIANNSEEIGDKCFNKFKTNETLSSAKIALAAYRNVLYANNILLKIQKEN